MMKWKQGKKISKCRIKKCRIRQFMVFAPYHSRLIFDRKTRPICYNIRTKKLLGVGEKRDKVRNTSYPPIRTKSILSVNIIAPLKLTLHRKE